MLGAVHLGVGRDGITRVGGSFGNHIYCGTTCTHFRLGSAERGAKPVVVGFAYEAGVYIVGARSTVVGRIFAGSTGVGTGVALGEHWGSTTVALR